MNEQDSLIKKDKEKLKELQYIIEMEEWIENQYYKNYERLRLEGGHALAPEVKRTGLLQIIMYFRRTSPIINDTLSCNIKLHM